MDSNRKSSCATVVPPNQFKTNSYENSIDDVTTVTSNPTLFQKLKNKWQRHDTQFDEEKHSYKKSIKNSRGWMAAILMILIGVLIAITFILVGLGKSLTAATNNNNNSTIATNSTTATITITTTLTSTVT